jgi:prepilin-type N-terminal cleavage/methylation domain-containing protein
MGRLGLQEAYRELRKNKSGYTLVELSITMAVILVLSTIGMYSYFSTLAYARETVCRTNLKALKTAIEQYVLENDALPATLGSLDLEHLNKGYAKAMEDMGWGARLSLLLLKLDESDHAYAQFLTYENLKRYGAKEKLFSCPADDNGPPSYGINGNLAGQKWSETSPNEIIVADSDLYVFTSLDQLAARHDQHYLAIKKSGEILALPAAGDADSAGDGDKKVTVCHEGNTLEISQSALDTHLAHGDTLGPCQ